MYRYDQSRSRLDVVERFQTDLTAEFQQEIYDTQQPFPAGVQPSGPGLSPIAGIRSSSTPACGESSGQDGVNVTKSGKIEIYPSESNDCHELSPLLLSASHAEYVDTVDLEKMNQMLKACENDDLELRADAPFPESDEEPHSVDGDGNDQNIGNVSFGPDDFDNPANIAVAEYRADGNMDEDTSLYRKLGNQDIEYVEEVDILLPTPATVRDKAALCFHDALYGLADEDQTVNGDGFLECLRQWFISLIIFALLLSYSSHVLNFVESLADGTNEIFAHILQHLGDFFALSQSRGEPHD